MQKIIPYLLFVIAIVMIVLSFQAKILPPGLTGLGFLLIGLYFLRDGK